MIINKTTKIYWPSGVHKDVLTVCVSMDEMQSRQRFFVDRELRGQSWYTNGILLSKEITPILIYQDEVYTPSTVKIAVDRGQDILVAQKYLINLFSLLESEITWQHTDRENS